MGLEIGGYRDRPDWPKLGPSLLIATCLVVAIRTARRPSQPDSAAADIDLDKEIAFAAHLTQSVLATLVKRLPNFFPQTREPWYKPDGEDEAK